MKNPNRPALFLKKFLQQGVRVASIVPSSKWLAQAVLQNINWADAEVIVELGGGTGAITNEIIRHRPATCRVVVVEQDGDFVEILKERFGDEENVDIVHGDVDKLDEELTRLGIRKVSYFVSGLPFPSMKNAVQENMMACVREYLTEGGSYNQITEIPYIFKFVYKKFFQDVMYKNEPRNIPPGGVYICTRPIIIAKA